MSRILLAGEQWTSATTEVKGPTAYSTGAYVEEGIRLMEAWESQKHVISRFVTCRVPRFFPEELRELQEYDVICLSDIGAESFLFHPEMLGQSVRHPNRLKLLREYVSKGGGLLMIGGWMSFSGIDGKARYSGTAVEETLPVTCLATDDRQERPEGVTPKVDMPTHPILKKVPARWPFFLGYNKVLARDQADVILSAEGNPFLSAWDYGKGRTVAFASDCAPHWGPPEFLLWTGYNVFWNNLIGWLARAKGY
jgi:uncharacterized membrane protein